MHEQWFRSVTPKNTLCFSNKRQIHIHILFIRKWTGGGFLLVKVTFLILLFMLQQLVECTSYTTSPQKLCLSLNWSPNDANRYNIIIIIIHSHVHCRMPHFAIHTVCTIIHNFILKILGRRMMNIEVLLLLSENWLKGGHIKETKLVNGTSRG